MSWSITLSGTRLRVRTEMHEAVVEIERLITLLGNTGEPGGYVSISVGGFISEEDNNRRTISNSHSITELDPPTGREP